MLSFADIEMDTERYLLIRKGERVKVEPLVFDLLVHFVKHPNEVISRDDLIAAVWGGRIVSDATVSSCIKHARKVLGDSGTKQKYIKTVPRRGFQFVAEVCDTPSQTLLSSTPSPVKPPSYAAPSLIVLPFTKIKENPDLNNFTEGLAVNLETVLTRIPLLSIRSRTSFYANQDVALTARQLYENIGVDYVLEGHIQDMGDEVRINTQLNDAKSGFRLWSGQFEQSFGDDKHSMDDTVIAIISKLEPQLNRAIYNSMRNQEGQPSAQMLYLEANGVLALKGWHHDTFTEAAELLRKSRRLDKDFALAPAYLSLVLALGHRVGTLDEREHTQAEALEAAEQALQLETMNSTVLGFAGCAMADLGLLKRAIPILKKAIDLNPSNAQAWAALGSAYLLDREPDLAIKNLTHGIAISPMDNRLSVWQALLALALMLSHNHSAAKIQAEFACQRDDRTYMSRVIYAAILLNGNESNATLEALNDAYRIKPDLSHGEIEALVGPKLGHKLVAISQKTAKNR